MYFKKGKVLIISAPSGSGKTTIAKFLLSQNLNLVFSVSACSRKKRKNEIDGLDYYFLESQEFKKRIQNGDFLEWEEVYENAFYGTLRKDVEDKLHSGKNVIFDIDVKGALTLKEIFKKDSLSLYIDVPVNIIENRLRNRGTESEQNISKRLRKIKEEKVYKKNFDAIIMNIDLIKSKKEIAKRVKEFLEIK
tara:strand:- start:1022 stop:1597 length:576 start_codon:yes stop_codon:yes gene_type:complete